MNYVQICVDDARRIKDMKPFDAFKEDYPNANIEKYMEFEDVMDYYYANELY